MYIYLQMSELAIIIKVKVKLKKCEVEQSRRFFIIKVLLNLNELW